MNEIERRDKVLYAIKSWAEGTREGIEEIINDDVRRGSYGLSQEELEEREQEMEDLLEIELLCEYAVTGDLPTNPHHLRLVNGALRS